jgi:hypothetical protein
MAMMLRRSAKKGARGAVSKRAIRAGRHARERGNPRGGGLGVVSAARGDAPGSRMAAPLGLSASKGGKPSAQGNALGEMELACVHRQRVASTRKSHVSWR